MMARKEIARRFEKWLHGRGETFTMEDLIEGFEEMFPEVNDEAEANAIMKLLVEAMTRPPRKPLGRREIARRLDQFIQSKPVGSKFTVEEVAAAVFPELDEAAARKAAYGIAKDLGWEGDPWLRKAR